MVARMVLRRSQPGHGPEPRIPPPVVAAGAAGGFTLIEVLVTVSIICVLTALLVPVVLMLRESARARQAHQVVAQLTAGLNIYTSEDPTRSYPPADPDAFVRSDPTGASFHVVDALILVRMDAGLHPLVPDPDHPGQKVLVDPWQRPYRYQLDPGGTTPDQTTAPVRPDPNRLDWNARNVVPFGYVWSLGSPRAGHAGLWSTSDPDLTPGTSAPWIYPTTSPSLSASAP